MSRDLLIRCDAGPVHGLGHLSRCRVLGRAYRRLTKGGVGFVCWAPRGLSEEALAQEQFELVPAAGPIGSSDDTAATLRLARERNSDMIVIDARDLPPPYIAMLRRQLPVVCIDDDQRRDLNCDMLVNPNPWAKAEEYPSYCTRVVLAGPRANLVSETYFQTARARIALPVTPTILITMGGEDPANVTSMVVAALNTIDVTCRLLVAVGSAFTGHASLNHVVERSPHLVETIENENDLTSTVARADIAVSAGGTTCYELVAARVPTIAIAIADHQLVPLRDLAGRGAIIDAGYVESLNEEVIRRELIALLSTKERRHMLNSAMREVFVESGAAGIVGSMLGLEPITPDTTTAT